MAEIEQLRLDLATALQRHLSGSHSDDPKDQVRLQHQYQRSDTWRREFAHIGDRLPKILRHFAAGREVEPERIDPQIEPVLAGTEEADIFRAAALLWSVPVSRGYGRRMRFLIRDRYNGKLIGILALGDPVFNLRARDRWLGWSADARRQRLVHVMDAFVAGAVPPYNLLLGGKLVFSLVASAEIGERFSLKYRETAGIISGERKQPKLALVTVTSALGRSSLYNRLKLRDPKDTSKYLVDLQPIGWTNGYGHFLVSDDLFARLRRFLNDRGHAYADGHNFGDGPNWRMRVTRVALEELGLSARLQRHGIERQVYALPLADNCREFLLGKDARPVLSRPSAVTIASTAIERWVLPRAHRDRRYRDWDLLELERSLRRSGPE